MKGHYLAILNNNTIQAALPLFEVRSRLLGDRLISIPHATLCNPLVSTENEMNALLEAGIRLAKELKTPKVEIRTMAANSLIENGSLGINRHYKNHYLLLEKDPEDLKKAFHRSVRRKTSQAIKSNLTVKDGCNESDLKKFYQLYLMLRKQKGLPPQPYKFIKLLWEEFSPSKKINLLLVEYEKQPIAGMLFFKFKNRVSAELSGINNNFRNLCPDHLLLWEAIKSACNEGFEIFDFGRTSIANVGLMDFKKRWGTEIIDLPFYYYPKDAPMKDGERKSSRSYQIISNVCRKLPNSALKMVGNFIYHHV
jgi:hypothetical protein